jgi:2-oxoglutaroyl-CoA hydrolase
MTFADARLASLDGFRVEIDAAGERADVILDRPPFNIIEMPQRDQLRLVFEALDEDTHVRTRLEAGLEHCRASALLQTCRRRQSRLLLRRRL